MKFSKRNKIILIIGVIFIVFTIIIGFALKTKESNFPAKEIELVEDYEIIENDSQKIISSKEAGFSLMVPKDWTVKDYDSKISFFNSGENFCSGSIEIKKYAQVDHKDILGLSILIKQVETGEKGKDRDYAYSLISIDDKTFLKTDFDKDDKIIYISTKTLINNNIYNIDSGLFYSEECEQAFDNILQSVKIN